MPHLEKAEFDYAHANFLLALLSRFRIDISFFFPSGSLDLFTMHSEALYSDENTAVHQKRIFSDGTTICAKDGTDICGLRDE